MRVRVRLVTFHSLNAIILIRLHVFIKKIDDEFTVFVSELCILLCIIYHVHYSRQLYTCRH